MYVSREALSRRAAELERFARQRGLELGDMPRSDEPVARIGRLATRLGIDLRRAFDLERSVDVEGRRAQPQPSSEYAMPACHSSRARRT